MSARGRMRVFLHRCEPVGVIAGAFLLLGALLLAFVSPWLRDTAVGRVASAWAVDHRAGAQPVDWHLLVGAPSRDPSPRAGNEVQGVVVIMQQMTEPDAYALYRIQNGTLLPWLNDSDHSHHPILDPDVLTPRAFTSGNVAPGEYLLVIQAGGVPDTGSYRSFRIR